MGDGVGGRRTAGRPIGIREGAGPLAVQDGGPPFQNCCEIGIARQYQGRVIPTRLGHEPGRLWKAGIAAQEKLSALEGGLGSAWVRGVAGRAGFREEHLDAKRELVFVIGRSEARLERRIFQGHHAGCGPSRQIRLVDLSPAGDAKPDENDEAAHDARLSGVGRQSQRNWLDFFR
jgi:hypothetical protein